MCCGEGGRERERAGGRGYIGGGGAERRILFR